MSGQRVMPRTTARVRRSVCRVCAAQCEAYRAGKVDHDDPREMCPAMPPRWGCYGSCSDLATGRAEPAPVALNGSLAVRLTSPSLRRGARLTAKARHLWAALMRWVKAGCPLADSLTRQVRRAICERCPMWRPLGNAGLGECLDPRCGCTRMKRWLATESCPQGKWPEAGLGGGFRGIATLVKRWGAAVAGAVWRARKPRRLDP